MGVGAGCLGGGGGGNNDMFDRFHVAVPAAAADMQSQFRSEQLEIYNARGCSLSP